MNIRQLQYITEVVKQRLNISAAAKELHTSQPGVSKQIRLLETEVGAQIFVRAGNKVTGVTAFGELILPPAQRILADVAFVKAAAKDLHKQNAGTLVVATTHTQAHYVLPEVMKRFAKKNPKVRLVQRLGTPLQIAEFVQSGEADIGVTTNVSTLSSQLVPLPYRKFERILIVPLGHELLKKGRITLKMLARYPLVSYDPAYTGHQHIVAAFQCVGLVPNIALSASDADVIKACVEQDFGIGVLLEVAFDSKRDTGLQGISAGHLFQPAMVSIVLQRNHYLRSYCYDFIEMLSARWSRSNVQAAISSFRPSTNASGP